MWLVEIELHGLCVPDAARASEDRGRMFSQHSGSRSAWLPSLAVRMCAPEAKRGAPLPKPAVHGQRAPPASYRRSEWLTAAWTLGLPSRPAAPALRADHGRAAPDSVNGGKTTRRGGQLFGLNRSVRPNGPAIANPVVVGQGYPAWGSWGLGGTQNREPTPVGPAILAAALRLGRYAAPRAELGPRTTCVCEQCVAGADAGCEAILAGGTGDSQVG